ncbi:MAG: hypothetical protein HYR85_12870 [Planctomycetes bacterium]|nr:hypothetical protein [Planctomycetota bacterium]MBI3848303.1 hypothetical protein [Planctomycetota bacterium]
MRGGTIGLRIGLVCVLAFFLFSSAFASDVPWLSVTPPFAGPQDRVTLTVHGPAGYRVAVGSSYSNYGAGQRRGHLLLLGPDWRTAPVRAFGVLDAGGTWTSSVSADGITPGELYLQAGVFAVGSTTVDVTNGAALFVGAAVQNGLAIADLSLGKQYDCASPATVQSFEFDVTMLSTSPIREATITVPTMPMPTVYRLLPQTPEPDLWMVSSGYRYVFGFFYFDSAGDSNIGLFPDGTYTLNAVRPDGTTATISVQLGGTFPSVPLITSPACGGVGVGRNPTIAFTSDVGARYDVAVETSDQGGGSGQTVWRYRGVPQALTLPSSFLLPATAIGVSITASTPIGSASHKAISMRGHFTTGP